MTDEVETRTDDWVIWTVDRSIRLTRESLHVHRGDSADAERFDREVGTPEAPGPLRLQMYEDSRLQGQAQTYREESAMRIFLDVKSNLNLDPDVPTVGNSLLPQMISDVYTPRLGYPYEPTEADLHATLQLLFNVDLDADVPVARPPTVLSPEELATYVEDGWGFWLALEAVAARVGARLKMPRLATAREKKEVTKKPPTEGEQTRTMDKWEEAVAIGARVQFFLAVYDAARVPQATPEVAALRRQARDLWVELPGSLSGWMLSHGGALDTQRIKALDQVDKTARAYDRAGLNDAAGALQAFLASFTDTGGLAGIFDATPPVLTEWPGPWDTAEAVNSAAHWLYRAGNGTLRVHPFIDTVVEIGGMDLKEVFDNLYIEYDWRFAMETPLPSGGPGAAGDVPTLMMPQDDFTHGEVLDRRAALEDCLQVEMTATDGISTALREVVEDQIQEIDAVADLADWTFIKKALNVRDTYIPDFVMDEFINARVQIQESDYKAVWYGRTNAMMPGVEIVDTEDPPTDNRRRDYFDRTFKPTKEMDGDPPQWTGRWQATRIVQFNERRDDYKPEGSFSPARLKLRRSRFSISLAYIKTYTMKLGETAQEVADRFGMKLDDLHGLNPGAFFAHDTEVRVWAPIPWATIRNKGGWAAYQKIASERVRLLLGYLANDTKVFDPSSYTQKATLKRLFAETGNKDIWEAVKWPEGDATLRSLPGMKPLVPVGRDWTLLDLATICKPMPNATKKPQEHDDHVNNLHAIFPAIDRASIPSQFSRVKSAIEAARTDRRRGLYAAAWNHALARFLDENDDLRSAVIRAYNRVWRGYTLPTYPTDSVGDELVRSGPVVRGERRPWPAMVPYDYQSAAARRLVAEGGGMLAFGVGVGKTNTALFALGLARQKGLAKRPVILVPNSLERKWQEDLKKVLPDYRVEVIGTKLAPVARVPDNPRDPLTIRSRGIAEQLLPARVKAVSRVVKEGWKLLKITAKGSTEPKAARDRAASKLKKLRAELASIVSFNANSISSAIATKGGRIAWGIAKTQLPSRDEMNANANVRERAIGEAANQLATIDARALVIQGGTVTGFNDVGAPVSYTINKPHWRPKTESAIETADKWEEFRRGRFDAVIVPFKQFDKLPLGEKCVRAHIMEKTSILRAVEDGLYGTEGGTEADKRAIFTTEGGRLQAALKLAAKALTNQQATNTNLTRPLEPPFIFGTFTATPGTITPDQFQWAAKQDDPDKPFGFFQSARSGGAVPPYSTSSHAASHKPEFMAVVEGGGPLGPLNPVTGLRLGQPSPGPVTAFVGVTADSNAPDTVTLRVASKDPAGARHHGRWWYGMPKQWLHALPKALPSTEGDMVFFSQRIYIANPAVAQVEDSSIGKAPPGFVKTSQGDPVPRFVRIGTDEIAQVLRRYDGGGPNNAPAYLEVLRNPYGTSITLRNGSVIQGTPPNMTRALPRGTPVTAVTGDAKVEALLADAPADMDLEQYVAHLERVLDNPASSFRVEGALAWLGPRLKGARGSVDMATSALYEKAFRSPAAYEVRDALGQEIPWVDHQDALVRANVSLPRDEVAINPHAGDLWVRPPQTLAYGTVAFVENRANRYPDGATVPPQFDTRGTKNRKRGAQQNGAYFVLAYKQGHVELQPKAAADAAMKAINSGILGYKVALPVHVAVTAPNRDYGHLKGNPFTRESAKATANRLSRMPAPTQATSASLGARQNTWEDIGCDFLIVDEAHNFKKLYPSGSWGSQGGGQVEFLHMGGDSKRGWQMAFRTAAVRANGGRVVLLTATPASTSPLEFYNLLQYLGRPGERDASVFDPLGIETPGDFIGRFVAIETAIQAKPGGEPKQLLTAYKIANPTEFRHVFERYANFKTVDDAVALRGTEVANGRGMVSESYTEDGHVHGRFVPGTGSHTLPMVKPGDRLRVEDGLSAGDYVVVTVNDGEILTEFGPEHSSGENEQGVWRVYTGGRVPIAPPTFRVNLGMSPEQDSRYAAYQRIVTNAALGRRSGIGLMGILHKMSRTSAHLGLEWFAPHSVSALTLADENRDNKPKQKAGESYTDGLRAALPIGRNGELAKITPTVFEGSQPFAGWTNTEDRRQDILRIRWLKGDEARAARWLLPPLLNRDGSVVPEDHNADLPMIPAPFAPNPALYIPGDVGPIVTTDPTLAWQRDVLEIVLAYRPPAGKKGDKFPYLVTWRSWVLGGPVRRLYEHVEDQYTRAVERVLAFQKDPSSGNPPPAPVSPARILNAMLAEIIYSARVGGVRADAIQGQGGGLDDPDGFFRGGGQEGWDRGLLDWYLNLNQYPGNSGAWSWGAAYLEGHEALGRSRIHRDSLAALLAFGRDERGERLTPAALKDYGLKTDEVDDAHARVRDLRAAARARGNR